MRKFTKEISALLAAAAVGTTAYASLVSASSEPEAQVDGLMTVSDEIDDDTATAGVPMVSDEQVETITEDELPPTAGEPMPSDEFIETTTEEIVPLAGDIATADGDINGDGSFGVSDAVLLQKWLLAVPDTHLANWWAADYNYDGRLDVFDLCLMKRELIRTTVTAYVEPDTKTEYGSLFTVASDNLMLYLGPDYSYSSVASIPVGTNLTELGFNYDNDYWLFTEYDGKYGWIRTYEDDNKTRTVEYLATPDKPVIYLYPEEDTDVHVELELTEADLSTTYPKYNNGWDVTAYPDGTLLNKADGSHHRYLFWDAVNCHTRFDFSKGFCVAGSDTESFPKEKLTYMGLTEEEMNEFIVYWLPRMEHNAYNLISFQGDAYTDTAKLTITPTPDSMLRIFMTYVPLEDAVNIEPQELSTFERTGFTVVEWGGSKIR
ncbi:MAG: dockerin type I domain-containing protein [Ruminococcus flavefaciens]